MKVLVATLDWGLGHASRSMQVVDFLLDEGHEIFLASSQGAGKLLQQEYPNCTYLDLPPYNISYSKWPIQSLAVLAQAPKAIKSTKAEHAKLAEYHKTYQFDRIISDHRYGCWHPDVPTVFLAHQLCVMPSARGNLGRRALFRYHMSWLKPFDEIWVPDLNGEGNLSGSLSHEYPLPKNAHFVGPLSRFHSMDPTLDLPEAPEIVAILSGPEPQRSMLEDKLRAELSEYQGLSWLIQGKPAEGKRETLGQMEVFPHVDKERFAAALRSARLVISRSGYSSLMDYSYLGLKNICLIPTPGQSEQEYLADYLAKKGLVYADSQSTFYLEDALAGIYSKKGLSLPAHASALKENWYRWIKKHPAR